MDHTKHRVGYRSDIEGLRAIAILFVVAVHAGVPWLSGGFIGVDVFFVISGFLITGVILREVVDEGRFRFFDFYVRRLRRLLPAMIFMLLVTGSLAMLFLGPAAQIDQSSAGAAAALWFSNIHFAFMQLDYFALGSEKNIFLHTWSLGVEEQFYLLWPALLVWLLGRDGSRGLARVKVAMFILIAIGLLACVLLTYIAPLLAFYMMPLRAWQFAAGALVWLHFSPTKNVNGSVKTTARISVIWKFCGWLGFGMVALSALAFDSKMPYPGAHAVLPTLGTVLIVAGGSGAPLRGVSRALSWKPLQALGHLSYSLYLWHWPLLLLGQAVTGSDSPKYRVSWVLLSLILSVLSYRYVEMPIRHQQRWLTHSRTSLLGALLIMMLTNVLCTSWNSSAQARLHEIKQRYVLAHMDEPLIYRMGCDDYIYSGRVHICSFGSANAAHTAVLMGDSTAAQWFPAVASIFDRPGWRLLVLIKGSCPMVDAPFFYERIGREYTECSTWRRNSLQRIVALKPDVFIFGTISSDGFTQSQWVNGSERVLQKVAPITGHVYILRASPRLPFDGPYCLADHNAGWLKLLSACSVSSKNARDDQIYAWLQQASLRFNNVVTIDMTDLICPNSLCSAERDGTIIFRDSLHMTATFSKSLAPALQRKLELQGFLSSNKSAIGSSDH